ncbi:hypothetical protein BGZ96_000295 [Linnemannia gamsii]|uniref:Rho-GAP domain-containing protein n=1 Tax=Linnemannia gamsii TaxID=64522 RepID=A0ABQ7JPP1_9FUNG|nr:hypothetical protein BGZ96_000295 [Linnemannia gamsii]
MTSRHSRMPSDVDRDHQLPPTGLSRATPILPLGMPPMTKEAKESKEQALAWETALNRILQTMHGDDTARYLAYFKARIEIEDTYSRGLEKLASLSVSTRGSKSAGNTTNARDGPQGPGNNGGQGNNSGSFAEPDEIPTTLHKAYEALMDTTLQACRRRQPFIRLLKNLAGALASLKEGHEKQRKTQKENTKPVFQLYAEQRLVTVPKAKRNYEQRCRDVEQVQAIEDVEHLPVRERLKNLASTSGAAGRLVKSKRDMEDADSEYKTAVQTLEVFRMQREMRFDTAYKTMQGMIEDRGAKCRQCLEAYVNGEREQLAKATEEMDRFSVVINCIKPVGDTEQLSLSFSKDVNSHPKTVAYESYYKPVPESIFGMSLQEYVDKHRHPIPLVIIKCSEAIDRAGLNREGIYRVSGRHAQIMNLKRLFDSDEDGVDFTNPAYSEDCASIAAVLKIYLRELPQPLFPFTLNERIAYSSIPDRNVRLGELKGRLKALPGCNIDTLQFLIEHLRRIYEHVETNKMTLDNLSMIFTPAIFHDFNSAVVPGSQGGGTGGTGGGGGSGGGAGTGAGHGALDNAPTALSFASNTSLLASSPSSPSPNAAPWGNYPFPPTDHTSKSGQQQQQFFPQNQTLGFNHGSTTGVGGTGGAASTGRSSPMPMTATEGSSSSHSLPLPQQQNQLYGTSPQHAGSGMVATSPPPQAGFTSASAATTTSTAASWSNDLVLSDLILNSTSVFNVLPKLPPRSNSVYSTTASSIYSNSGNDDRHLSVAMSGTTLSGSSVIGGGSGGNNGISTARPFSNSRKSSASSLGVPSSPIDGGGNGQLRPRMDSLPNIMAASAGSVTSPRLRESEHSPSPPPQHRQTGQYQQYPPPPPLQQQQQQQQQQQHYQQQQQQQHQYQLPTPQPQQQYGYTEQRQPSPPSSRRPNYDSQNQQ